MQRRAVDDWKRRASSRAESSGATPAVAVHPLRHPTAASMMQCVLAYRSLDHSISPPESCVVQSWSEMIMPLCFPDRFHGSLPGKHVSSVAPLDFSGGTRADRMNRQGPCGESI